MKKKRTLPRTITKVPRKDGGWFVLDWPNLALTTAKILEYIPKSPPFVGEGLLGRKFNSEDQFPHLDWALAALREILDHLENYAKTGTVNVLDRDGRALVSAMAGIQVICERRWGSLNLHRDIPIEIAAIARTVSIANKINAKGERPTVDRRSPLTKAIARERQKDRNATAMNVLNLLCGGEVVKECKDGRVWYWNEKGTLTSIGLDRFETIFSEQKPSTG